MFDNEENISNISMENYFNKTPGCPDLSDDQIDNLLFTTWLLNGVVQLFFCIIGKQRLLK